MVELFFYRFVSFFICPVFHEKNIQHHIEIIQCEHEKNKQNDVWRTKQVFFLLIQLFILLLD